MNEIHKSYSSMVSWVSFPLCLLPPMAHCTRRVLLSCFWCSGSGLVWQCPSLPSVPSYETESRASTTGLDQGLGLRLFFPHAKINNIIVMNNDNLSCIKEARAEIPNQKQNLISCKMAQHHALFSHWIDIFSM